MAYKNRNLEAYFAAYAARYKNKTNKLIQGVCVPLLIFGLLGLVWSIPFPQINGSGAIQRYINWATFLIVFTVIYYFRLSILLALGMLAIIAVFSAVIVTLEKLHREVGWPPLWLVCLFILIIAWALKFIGQRIEGKKLSFRDNVTFLLIGPIWLLHIILKKIHLPY